MNSLSICAPKFESEVCGVCVQVMRSLKTLKVCDSRYESEAIGSLCSGPPISKLLRLCPIVGVQVFEHLCSLCEVFDCLRVRVTKFESEVSVGLCSRCEVSEILDCLCSECASEVFGVCFQGVSSLNS